MLDRPWDRGMGTHGHWGRSSTTDGLSLPVCAEREAEARLLELRQPPFGEASPRPPGVEQGLSLWGTLALLLNTRLTERQLA